MVSLDFGFKRVGSAMTATQMARFGRRKAQMLSFVAAAILAGTISANAQNLPDAPHAVANLVAKSDEAAAPMLPARPTIELKRPERPAVHRFFDKTTFALSGVATAALLADGITTQNKLGQTFTEYRSVNGQTVPVQMQIKEVDPVGKLFVNHGWPGQIAGGAATLGADLGVRYWLHRTNHHRIERIVPFVFAASNAYAAWHNSRY